jgi:small subunit ribosomal protein S20
LSYVGTALSEGPHKYSQINLDCQVLIHSPGRPIGQNGRVVVSFYAEIISPSACKEVVPLAHTRSAIKRLRQNEKRRARNRFFRATARTEIKKTRRLIEAGELDEAREAVVQAIKALDKAAQKGVIHKNNAARRKSRLMKYLNAALQQAGE